MWLLKGFGDFQPADVHKQYGICFKTPKYKNIEVSIILRDWPQNFENFTNEMWQRIINMYVGVM